MQIIVKILGALVPYIINFLNKHSDEYLEIISRKVASLLGEDEVATVHFNIITKTGEPVANTVAKFIIVPYGEVYKKSVGSSISITGLKEGKHDFEIIKDDKSMKVSVEVEENNSVIEKVIVFDNLA